MYHVKHSSVISAFYIDISCLDALLDGDVADRDEGADVEGTHAGVLACTGRNSMI